MTSVRSHVMLARHANWTAVIFAALHNGSLAQYWRNLRDSHIAAARAAKRNNDGRPS